MASTEYLDYFSKKDNDPEQTSDTQSTTPEYLRHFEGQNRKVEAQVSEPEAPKSGVVNDTLVGLGKGVMQIPGALTGLADIPAGLAGYDRPFSKAAESAGEATGFTPGKWAKEADKDYSPAMQTAKANIEQAWTDPNTDGFDVAGAYLKNPRAIAGTVVESLPSMAAGNVIGMGAKAAGLTKSLPVAAGIGEGSIMAGQAMENIDKSVDPRKAALASTAIGAGGGLISGLSGKIATKAGFGDVDQAFIAQGQQGLGNATTPMWKRVVGGALTEGPLEEGSQSALESGTQNWVEGKPITEGMARNVVEGSLAGAAMGGPMGVFTGDTQAQPIPIPEPQATPEAVNELPEEPEAEAIPTPTISQPVEPAQIQAEAPSVDPRVKTFTDKYKALGEAKGFPATVTNGLAKAATVAGVYDANDTPDVMFDKLYATVYPQAVEKTPQERIGEVVATVTETEKAKLGTGTASKIAAAALDANVAQPQIDAAAQEAERLKLEQDANAKLSGENVAETPEITDDEVDYIVTGVKPAPIAKPITEKRLKNAEKAVADITNNPDSLESSADVLRKAAADIGVYNPELQPSELLTAVSNKITEQRNATETKPEETATAQPAPQGTDTLTGQPVADSQPEETDTVGSGEASDTSGVKQPWELSTAEWQEEKSRLVQEAVSAEAEVQKAEAKLNKLTSKSSTESRIRRQTELSQAKQIAKAKRTIADDFPGGSNYIYRAMQEGKPIPDHVLAEYPDIATEFGRKLTPITENPLNVESQNTTQIDPQNQENQGQKTEEVETPIDDTLAREHPLHDANDYQEAEKPEDTKKAAVNFQDLPVIGIENPKGSIRKGKGWEREMQDHYGEFASAEGADGDGVDVFIPSGLSREQIDSTKSAFIVDQIDPKTGLFDEHKTLVGYPNKASAEAAYRRNYEPGWQGMGAITEMPMPEFKTWLKDPVQVKKPVSDTVKTVKTEEVAQVKQPFEMTGEEYYAAETEGYEPDQWTKGVLEDEHYAKIEEHAKSGGLTDARVIDSLPEGKRNHFYKKYGAAVVSNLVPEQAFVPVREKRAEALQATEQVPSTPLETARNTLLQYSPTGDLNALTGPKNAAARAQLIQQLQGSSKPPALKNATNSKLREVFYEQAGVKPDTAAGMADQFKQWVGGTNESVPTITEHLPTIAEQLPTIPGSVSEQDARAYGVGDNSVQNTDGEELVTPTNGKNVAQEYPLQSKTEMRQWLVGKIDAAILEAPAKAYKDIPSDADLEALASLEKLVESYRHDVIKKQGRGERGLAKATVELREKEIELQALEAKGSDKITFKIPGGTQFKVTNDKPSLEAFKKKVLASPGFRETKATATNNRYHNTPATQVVNNFLKDGELENAYYAAQELGVEIGFSFSEEKEQLLYTGVEHLNLYPGRDMFIGQGFEGDKSYWAVIDGPTGKSVNAKNQEYSKAAALASAKKRLEILTKSGKNLDGATGKTQAELLAEFKKAVGIASPAAPTQVTESTKTEAPVNESDIRQKEMGDIIAYVFNEIKTGNHYVNAGSNNQTKYITEAELEKYVASAIKKLKPSSGVTAKDILLDGLVNGGYTGGVGSISKMTSVRDFPQIIKGKLRDIRVRVAPHVLPENTQAVGIVEEEVTPEPPNPTGGKKPENSTEFNKRAEPVAKLIAEGKPVDAYFLALKTKVPLSFEQNEDKTITIHAGGLLTEAFRSEDKKWGEHKRKEAIFREQHGIKDKVSKAKQEYLDRQAGQASLQSQPANPENHFATAPEAQAFLVEQFGPGVNNLVNTGRVRFTLGKEEWPEAAKDAAIQASLEAMRLGNKPGNYEAVYLNGTAYLDLQATTKERLPAVLLHEIGEHFNLRRMLGTKGYTELLNQITIQAKIKGSQAEKIWQQVKRLYPDIPVGDETFVSEVIAKLGETNPNLPWYRRLVAKIKAFLMQHGLARGFITGTLTDADMHALLVASLQSAAKGRVLNEARLYDDSALASRTPETQAASEKRVGDLFKGVPPLRHNGVKILDKSDILNLLGIADKEVQVAEYHGIVTDKERHVGFTEAEWNKVPDWLDNPVAVFKQEDGDYRFFGPELVGGHPVIMVVETDSKDLNIKGRPLVHVLKTAFSKDQGKYNTELWVKNGELAYVNVAAAPAFNAASGYKLPTVYRDLKAMKRAHGLGPVQTEKNLADFHKKEEVKAQEAKAKAKESEEVKTQGVEEEDVGISNAMNSYDDKVSGNDALTEVPSYNGSGSSSKSEGSENSVATEAGKVNPEKPQFSRTEATITVDGKERPVTNSKGKPIAQTEEGLRNFWKWFGGSTTVNKQGQPDVYYHGTTKDISAFDTSKSGANKFEYNDNGLGSWFANRPGEKGFSSQFTNANGFAGTEQVGTEVSAPTGANVIPSYVSMLNPKIYEYNDYPAAVKKARSGKNLKAKLEAEGYDGVIRNGFDSEPMHIAVFNPNQIKSAIGNNGAFSPDSNDIRFSHTAAQDYETEPDQTLQDRAQGVKVAAKNRMRTLLDLIDKQRTAFLSVLQMEEQTQDYLPGMSDYTKPMHARRTKIDTYLQQADRILTPWKKFNKATRDALAYTMHESTLADVNASKAWSGVTTLQILGETVSEPAITAYKVHTQAELQPTRRAALLAKAQEINARNGQPINPARYTATEALFKTEQQAQEYLALVNATEQEQTAFRAGLYKDENPKRRSVLAQVQAVYNRLPKAAQDVYVKTDAMHNEMAEDKLNILEDRVSESIYNGEKRAALIATLRAKFESGKLNQYYAPLSRFGDYWYYGLDANNEPVFESFENTKERDDAAKAFEDQGGQHVETGTNIQEMAKIKSAGVSDSFITSVIQLIDSSEINPKQAKELQDEIYQMYLTNLPEVSMRHGSQHRKGTRGFEKDAMKSFAYAMHHNASQIANMKEGREMEQALTELDDTYKMSRSKGPGGKLEQAKTSIEAAKMLIGQLDTDGEIEDLDGMLTMAEDDHEVNVIKAAKELVKKFGVTDPLEAASAMNSYVDKLEKRIARSELITPKLEVKAANYISELHKTFDAMMNTQTGDMDKVAAYARQFGFIYMLGFGISSALMNTAQTPIVAMPVVQARYGLPATTATFGRAYADFNKAIKLALHTDAQGNRDGVDPDGNASITEVLKRRRAALTPNSAEWRKTNDEIFAMKAWKLDGTISRTQTHDVISIGKEGEEHGGPLLELSKKMGWMFHHGERLNREVTLLAAFRLAMEGANGVPKATSVEQAMDYAKKVTDESHLEYSPENAARIFRGWPASVALQFKKYSQGMYYLWGKNAKNWLNGWKDMPEVTEAEKAAKAKRKAESGEARRTLAGLLVMQTSVAGVFGLPLTGMLAVTLDAIANAVDGDDDDDKPYDIRKNAREWLADNFGDTWATAVTKGFVNASTPIDTASRMDLANLMFRDNLQDLEGRDQMSAWLTSLFGPTGGIAQRLWEGFKLVSDGETGRGIEQLLPKFASDPLQAFRFATEDARSLEGSKLKDMNAFEVGAKVFGIGSSSLNSKYEERGDAKGDEYALRAARRKLLKKAAQAKMDGEPLPLEEIRAWRRKHPGKPITMDNIRASIKATKRGEKQRGDKGYYVDPKWDIGGSEDEE